MNVLKIHHSISDRGSPGQARTPHSTGQEEAEISACSREATLHEATLSSCTFHKKRSLLASLKCWGDSQKKKSKIVTKLTIQDESLELCGDLREQVAGPHAGGGICVQDRLHGGGGL